MNLIVYVLFEDFIIVISKLIHAALIYICKYGCQLAAIGNACSPQNEFKMWVYPIGKKMTHKQAT